MLLLEAPYNTLKVRKLIREHRDSALSYFVCGLCPFVFYSLRSLRSLRSLSK